MQNYTFGHPFYRNFTTIQGVHSIGEAQGDHFQRPHRFTSHQTEYAIRPPSIHQAAMVVSPYNSAFGLCSQPNAYPGRSYSADQRTNWRVSPCRTQQQIPEPDMFRKEKFRPPQQHHQHKQEYPEAPRNKNLSAKYPNGVVSSAKQGPGSIHDDARLLLEAAKTAATRLNQSPINNVSQTVSRDVSDDHGTKYADLVEGSVLTSQELYGSVPDSLYVSMAQMKLCRLRNEDQFGNYKHREVGFVGMACKHCGGLPGFGRHFPGSFQSLLSGSHCARIVKHMRSECKACPENLRDVIETLESKERLSSSAQPDHGSRKRFVAYVWAQLRKAQAEAPEATEQESMSEDGLGSETDENRQDLDTPDFSWEIFVRDSKLVSIKDRHLVPDTTFFSISQMIPWPLTKEDQIGRHKERPIGFVGMCCRHCGGKTGKPRYGRYFPSCIKTMVKPASCDRIANHLASECPKCPLDVRNVIHMLQAKELVKGIRYGSRNIFFQRVWTRLHKGDSTLNCSSSDSSAGATKSMDKLHDKASASNQSDMIQWDLLLAGSTLITHNDIGSIPDGQLATLEPCFLTKDDKVGWYKDRPVNFGGLACRFCKGRPGCGRYFPNTLRTFSQNDYCQIVGNHLSRDCKDAPEELKNHLLSLLKDESSMLAKTSKSKFPKGSRKALYDRIWDRMHRRSNVKKATDSSPGSKRSASDATGSSHNTESPSSHLPLQYKKLRRE